MLFSLILSTFPKKSMKKLNFIIVLAMLLTTSFKSTHIKKQPAVTLSAVKYTFFTTNNDKDWGTQVGAQIIYDSRTVAENFCCNTDHKDDHWKNNTNSPEMEMLVHEHLTKEEFNHSTCVITARANGNDKWEYDLRIHAEFSDRSEENWTILNQTLNSIESRRVSNTYALSEGKKY